MTKAAPEASADRSEIACRFRGENAKLLTGCITRIARIINTLAILELMMPFRLELRDKYAPWITQRVGNLAA